MSGNCAINAIQLRNHNALGGVALNIDGLLLGLLLLIGSPGAQGRDC